MPAERYADWAAGPRESLSRLHIQLLELLLADAVASEHLQDAFGFVDRLIECDPYNEQHHLVLAELYAKSGNRRTAPSGCSNRQRPFSTSWIFRLRTS